MLKSRDPWFALVLGLAWLTAPAASAESGLRLPYPRVFETIPASTYDDNRQRVGDAHLVIERLENGNVRILSRSGIEGGARTVATAELAPIDTGRTLRILTEESRSFDPAGQSIGVLSIDHGTARASCSSPNGEPPERLALPSGDRVANVPLNLLFLPLVKDEVEKVTFQFMLCRGGPRLVDVEARVVHRDNGSNGQGSTVEVQYGPDFGPVVSLLAQRLVPRLSFWFDPEAQNPWLAHRLPLYSKGPEVFVIREGVPMKRLSAGQ